MACNYICPRYGSVWIADYDSATHTNPGFAGPFTKLPEVQSWTLDADVTDPDEFVTSGTNGVAVSPCVGTTSWSATVNFKLCPDDWIYCYLLSGGGTLGGWDDPGLVVQKWFYFTWLNVGPTVTPNAQNLGVYMVGQVNPSGFGIDNNSTSAAETEPTIRGVLGPFLPACSAFAIGT